jgi:hypothetical protein
MPKDRYSNTVGIHETADCAGASGGKRTGRACYYLGLGSAPWRTYAGLFSVIPRVL